MGKHFKTYVTILLCLICSVFQIKAVSNNDELIKKLEAQLIASEEANNIDSALEKAQQLINVLNQINDVQNWVNVVTTKAEMLRSIADLEKALETINQAEEKAEKHCKGPILARFYNRKASILFELKISTEALAYVLKSQAANLTYPDQGIEFSNLNLLGAIYRDAHDYNKATTVLQELNRKSFKSKDTSEYLLSCYNLALTFQKQNEFDSVLKYAFGYVHFTPELYNRQVGEHMYHCIAQAYEKLEKYDLAYQYLDTTHLYRLQTLEEMMQGRISEHRAKSQLTIQQLENERLIERNKSKQNQLYLMLLLVVLAGFALVYFIFQRKKLRQASIQQAQLNQELKETLKFKNKLIAIVAHDIRNPMNGITGITELFANGSVKPHEVPAFMTKLDASSRSVNLLLENLLNWVKSQSDGFSLNLSEVSLHSLIKDVQLETNTQLNEKGIALKVDLSQAPERVKTDVNMLELVVRNVLTNSIKYSESNTAISVSYEEQIGYHALKIADNGVGMSKETIAELLNSNNRKSTQGTKSEKGTGLGIGLCQDMMGVLGGDLEIESELGKGTTVTIKFPKSKSVAVR